MKRKYKTRKVGFRIVELDINANYNLASKKKFRSYKAAVSYRKRMSKRKGKLYIFDEVKWQTYKKGREKDPW